jgi:M6 family metalloprotease-like protein
MLLSLLASSLLLSSGALHHDPLAEGLSRRTGLLFVKNVTQQDGECRGEWQLATRGQRTVTVELSDNAYHSLIDGGQKLPARVQLAGEWSGETMQAKRLYNILPGMAEGPNPDPDLASAFPNTGTPIATPSDGMQTMGSPVETRKYLNLIVRFADSPGSDPHARDWYVAQMRTTFPGMDHFYATDSFGKLRVSSQIEGWINLPGVANDYKSNGGYDVQKLINGAVPLVDANVDFSTIWGINVFPNRDDNSGFSYATSASVTSAEGSFFRPVTMLNPWTDQFVLVHEMGHNFDFDHSSTGNDVYNSNWSPMGNGGRYWTNTFEDFGSIACEHNSYHKEHAGWFDKPEVVDILPGKTRTVRIERIGNPTQTGFKMARVMIPGISSRYYSVESRKFAGYDTSSSIAGESVIIHQIDLYKAWNPGASRLIDIDGNGDTSDEGTMWRVGETFTGENGVSITVTLEDATGFKVNVSTPAGSAVPGVVTNTNDSGPGSLRDAIAFANLFGGKKVTFDIPLSDPGYASGYFTIKPTTVLTSVSDSGVIIDGASQTRKTGDTNPSGPEIFIDGSLAGAFANGLNISGSGNTVKGLAIGNFDSNAIRVDGNLNTITGCVIGMTANQTTAAPNGSDAIGIYFGASNNRVGGPTVADRNIIGSSRSGVALYGTDCTENDIVKNYLGFSSTANVAFENTFGVLLFGGAHHNDVRSNYMSGNYEGLYIQDATTNANLITQNTIGLLPTHAGVLANTFGVVMNGGSDNSFGGATSASGNKVMGSGAAAMNIVNTSNLLIRNNQIGSPAFSGASRNGAGIRAESSANLTITGNEIQSNHGNGIYLNLITGATIGGTSASASNRIFGNDNCGITTLGSTSVAIRGNDIYGNGALGIDIGNNGVSTNDAGDGDGITNYPVVSVRGDGLDAIATITVAGKPNTTYSVDVFAVAAADATGFGEGDDYLTSRTLTTNGSGTAAFNYRISGDVQFNTISATATTATGSTSEFSQVFASRVPVITLGDLSGSRGTTVKLRSKVTNRLTGAAVSGQTVDFYVRGALVGSVVTNVNGVSQMNYVIPATGPTSLSLKATVRAGLGYTDNTAKATLTVTP